MCKCARASRPADCCFDRPTQQHCAGQDEVHKSHSFSGYNQDLSNITLQLTAGCTSAQCAFNVQGAGGQQEITTHTNNLPGGTSIYGIKFEGLGGNQNGTKTITFDSLRNPMYGNISVFSGGGLANNTGLVNPASGLFIPVPDTTNFGQPPLVGPIPEPGTIALLASGLLAVAGVARKRGKSA